MATLNESEKERIRRAVHLEKKSINRVAQEEGYSRQTVEKVLSLTPPQPNPLPRSRSSPVFGSYQQRADALLRQNEQMPRKQRYTAHKIFEILQEEGYQVVNALRSEQVWPSNVGNCPQS